MAILRSVGKNGANDPDDVRTVRTLLNQNRHLLIPFKDLPISGNVDDDLAERIGIYQRRVVTEITVPDGQVDPGGFTIAKLEANAKNLEQVIPLFPLHARPSAPFDAGGRKFGARRNGGRRRHAACDMLAAVGTKVRAMDDGVVIAKPRIFFLDTIALEVDHGHYTARYGEMSHVTPGLNRAGAVVTKGQTLGFVGQLRHSSMLHLELYSGALAGPLSTNAGPFRRRADLLNPTDFLNVASLEIEDAAPPPFPDVAFARVGARIISFLNMRTNPDIGAAVLEELGVNERLKVLDQTVGGNYPASGGTRNDWLKVKFNDKEGFVAAFFVDPEVSRGRVNANVDTRLRVRGQPQIPSPIVDDLTPGTSFVVLREIEGDEYTVDGITHKNWYQIEYNGQPGFVAGFFVDVVGEGAAPGDLGDPNAILFTLEPKGASDRTANQDGLPQQGIHGVDASIAMAKTDRTRVMRFKDQFQIAARETDLPPALLAAIASRESRGGNALDRNGFGDNGHGFGIMQIDDRSFRADMSEGPDGPAHISQAADILAGKLDRVRARFESLSDTAELQTAVSRFNGGSGRPAPDSDQGTTGGDYSNDVWARARHYAQVENWL